MVRIHDRPTYPQLFALNVKQEIKQTLQYLEMQGIFFWSGQCTYRIVSLHKVNCG